MKALTLRQPWASAIMAGVKKVENRNWAPKAIKDGPMWILIHAGRGNDSVDLSDLWDAEGVTGQIYPDRWPRGLLGMALIESVVLIGDYDMDDPWAIGPKLWIISEVRELAVPIPCKGALGLWEIPDGVLPDFYAEGLLQ